MTSANIRGGMHKLLKVLFACIAVSLLWMLLQFVVNLGAHFLGAMRDEGEWWLSFMKNIVSPALSAYFAFVVVEHYYEEAPWKVVGGFFLAALLVYTAWSISFNSEHYLLAHRTEEWRSILWGTIFGTASAFVGALVFCVPKFRGAT